jgi:hypothetical protein
MANNQNVNKVVINNAAVIDLTADTVDASHLLQGYTAHDASGAAITGTATAGGGGGGRLRDAHLAYPDRRYYDAYDMTDNDVAIDIAESDWGDVDATFTAVRAYAFVESWSGMPIFGYGGRLRSVTFPAWITAVGEYVCRYCHNLQEMHFTGVGLLDVRGQYNNATLVGNCRSLTEIDFGERALRTYTTSGYYTIADTCAALEHVEVPIYSGSYLTKYSFRSCNSLKTVIVTGEPSQIAANAIDSCSAFATLVIDCPTLVAPVPLGGTLSSTNPTAIYVNDALVEAYKTATNWNTYATMIHPLSEYTGWRQS